MGRPTKQGVDYFPLDTSMDMDINLFIADTGASGFGVLIATWQLIYKENGYYINYSDDLFLMIRRMLMVGLVWWICLICRMRTGFAFSDVLSSWQRRNLAGNL